MYDPNFLGALFNSTPHEIDTSGFNFTTFAGTIYSGWTNTGIGTSENAIAWRVIKTVIDIDGSLHSYRPSGALETGITVPADDDYMWKWANRGSYNYKGAS